jgi:hypothetical protein
MVALVGALGVLLMSGGAAAATDFSMRQDPKVGPYLDGTDLSSASNSIQVGVDPSDHYWMLTDLAGIGEIPAACERDTTAGTILCDPRAVPLILLHTGPGNDLVTSLRSSPPRDVTDESGGFIFFDRAFPSVQISMGPGRDRFQGNEGRSTVAGDAGPDRLQGGEQGDLLFGGPGRDLLLGMSGADDLIGGPGADILRGGLDIDLMLGGKGRDHCTGAPGDRVGSCEHTRVKRFN